jgi:hypothetical protein
MQKIKEESAFRVQVGEDLLTVAIFKTTWFKDWH